ncbi:hypothetical protein SARC_10637 [Sphaeroforma arctica JP610]|uniref:RRP15-like protein n=1 Tax=Sphaeroforma arctica JP610 TaxID=667725 RepID=A0A0L0FJD9_9EUKA|nr:hypothetical protein SARC_10637 [Sphaeroforma arctica JP610]KNC76885.1 hypothetical protein SARC_10637 [Sphaeroforma arctica JP610]|eukprot:XP_014150787.1 hypothetical protein SARC_10637 [Sphaeroforma arctica JP610]
MSKILHPDIADADDGPILAKDNQVKRKIEETSKEEKSRKLTALEKKERKEKGHVDASKSSRMYERKLQKVATRGLVKLFNTIRKQQQELDANLDGVAEGKKKKVINETLDKAKFIDMLKTKTISKETQLAARLTGDGAESAGATTQPNARQNGVDWLSTDYLMTHKMKHFDRETTDLEVVDDGGHEEVNSDEE